MKLSCYICVCRYDDLEHFKQAVQSILQQSRMPDQLVICLDGQLGEQTEKYISTLDATLVRTSSGGDHARVRNAALSACKHEYVAVMDADDIALPDRFEKQLAYLTAHPETDVLGGQIEEFSDTGKQGVRRVKTDDGRIKKDMKKRCPMNQMTVVLKKSSVERVGGYMSLHCNEDYYLWARMAKDGRVFANLPDVLCCVRVGEGTYKRRGGKEYYESEKSVQHYMRECGMISTARMFFNISVRYFVQMLLSNRHRAMFYAIFLRKKRKK